MDFVGMDHARSGQQWLSGCLLALFCLAGLAQPRNEAQEPTPEQRAHAAWQAGYVFHVLGDYQRAIEYFRASIAAHPTAEAHTFLGWSMSHLGRIGEAIAQCEIAIRLDPDFGNPYNDIGVYLIELERDDDAVAYLEKAKTAKRYCCYQFPHFNLGRIYLKKKLYEKARAEFKKALEIDPTYEPAQAGLELLKELGIEPS